jgi:hypothetical protein
MLPRCLTVAISLVVCTATLAETPDNPHLWQPELRSVTVFKNGLGFFVRQGSATPNDGWCVAEQVPPALFGTFAIYAAEEGELVDIIGSGVGQTLVFDGEQGPDEPADIAAALGPYLNLPVKLTTRSAGQSHDHTGTLHEVSGKFAILRSDPAHLAIPLEEITQMQVADYPVRVHVQRPAERTGSTELGMAYLQKGITWIPDYTLRILNDDTAELTLRATLINEVEDLIGTDVNFVVGVPHFLHSDYLTPLAVGQTIRSVSVAIPQGAGIQSQMLSNALMNRAQVAADQRSHASPTPAPSVDSMLGSLPQMGGSAAEFTVYTKENLTLRKGERAVITIFRKTIQYSHTHRWDSPGDLRHFLALENSTNTAWTTGPVLAVEDQRPLCQDLIRYTPIKGRYDLPVTTGINISTNAIESEIDRRLRAHQPGHSHFFDLVTVEGRLIVENYQPQAAKLTVTRHVPGLGKRASDGGTIRQDTSNLQLSRRNGTITWQLTVEPGERKELTYVYERYVPSN